MSSAEEPAPPAIHSKPDREGFLKKQGGRFKAYKKRWFQLHESCLYYFKNPGERPAGVIPLQGCRQEEEKERKAGFGWTIGSTLFPRTYFLLADTEAEKKSWMSDIQKAIERADKLGDSGVVRTETEDLGAESTIVFQSDSKPSKVGLKDFELCKVVGRGSFGKVMKVRKKDTGEVFAMKVLKKDMIIRENMVQHTKSEKSILQMIHHPFIVNLCYAFQTEDKLYLILDFLSGGELFFHLKNEGRFSEDRSRIYCAQIVLAIEHLHKHDIIYRDLKPENVVLDKHGFVCLTDFGLAKTAISNQTPTYTFCGTPEYLAPEILTGQGHAKAVDWWSLGILLYEMLTGLPPFYSENINEMYELILKAPLKFPSHITPSAQSLLRGLLERDEFKRFGSGPTDGEEIRQHPFFASVDWDKLFKREVTPPFIPKIKGGDDDTQYFDEEFTREQARDSFSKSEGGPADPGSKDFAGFTFVRPSELSK